MASKASGMRSISRRAILKGLGLAAAGGALQGSLPAVARAALKSSGRPAARCFIYLDEAARNQWVLGAVLVGDPRRLRQLLRRAKRHRLPRDQRAQPGIEARLASPELKRYFYQLLARDKGFRKGLGQGLEIYAIHADRGTLAAHGDRIGIAQLRMVITLLSACRLARFREIFVYHNLPGLKGLSHKQVRTALLQGTRRHPDARFEVYKHRARRRTFDRTRKVERILVDEGIQAADFVTHAFFREFEYGDLTWVAMIQRLVRRRIDAAQLPELEDVVRLG